MSRLGPEIHPLLTEDVVKALHGRKVWTVGDFVKVDTQQIIKIARLNFREVRAVKNYLLKKFSATPVNGFDFYKNVLKNTAIIPTGIKGVDQLLNGGLFTGNIYELCGPPASGKTHFVLTLIKNVILNMDQNVHIFDTKNDFSAVKMKQMLKNCDEDRRTKSLGKIIVNRCYTRYDLINSLYEIKNDLENNMKLRLIIVDSLPGVILNSNDHLTNNLYLNHIANIMRYIATEHHVAFLVTNLITTWTDGGFKTQQETSETITCGKYWSSVPNTRLRIEKMENSGGCKLSVLRSDTLNQKVNSCADIVPTEDGFL
ncbi:DNA repair protein RAD51 homolog 4 [Tribolium castaneum]|uniref:DNA repair protein RAD51 homolog 4-like Protein n=1 Tax=Tribolium castaneum TaxID=7070 RepID=D6X266_TRICA|nr:PREDICTED: DNA repair protein RAD51 homolog 4 [Tribolium castaneum]XP_008197801.1 PREDICTED: DNA repair protein RAD51 homolog 4 [Tribolium castaneum]XP_008197802.1 PREDICTED: DNA repair protein RAD51 homolog 4 [Tribolium castaneum]EFA10219.1 DNA repair protein RAD51 homolog 4-like Protein [Tribolium castaneum]|eukprot:XP_008197800.1 PREDICTED: DNA repair protein RAD51 homolog 4 [Tribolium castaneum]